MWRVGTRKKECVPQHGRVCLRPESGRERRTDWGVGRWRPQKPVHNPGCSDFIVGEPKRGFEKHVGDTIRFSLENTFRWQGDDRLEGRRRCGSPTRLSIDATWGASERLMPGPASRQGAGSALGSLFLRGSLLGGTVAIQVRSLETEEDAHSGRRTAACSGWSDVYP